MDEDNILYFPKKINGKFPWNGNTKPTSKVIQEINPGNITIMKINGKKRIRILFGKIGILATLNLEEPQLWRIRNMKPGDIFLFNDIETGKQSWIIKRIGDDLIVKSCDFISKSEDEFNDYGKINVAVFLAKTD